MSGEGGGVGALGEGAPTMDLINEVFCFWFKASFCSFMKGIEYIFSYFYHIIITYDFASLHTYLVYYL